ncbi:protocadherin Fat 1-like [Gigantopelta aegis]|uniref:protocadherin Fat 1-like n=1 Tax=Gigantopelta aegis TaxID=1735272 RepID=UPI001B8895D5|nr:protocadherin Fat 1-like [Gigantopelta aegis]
MIISHSIHRIRAGSSPVVRVLARDGGSPSLSATAIVLVNVNRNLNAPTFVRQNHTVEIYETQDLGVPIMQVTAVDVDVSAPDNVISYTIIDDSLSREYFGIVADTGAVFVRKALGSTSSSQFTVRVQVTDKGSPPKTGNLDAFVFVTVIRNLHTPVFSSTPCNRELSQNIAIGTSVTQVVATDADSANTPFGRVRYEIIGDDSAPVYFDVNPSMGVVTVRDGIAQESVYQYRIRIRARDEGVPFKFNTTVCLISITRNFRTPVFSRQSYVQTVDETFPLGSVLLKVNATDSDVLPPNNVLRYKIVDDAEDLRCFIVNEVTGQILLRRSLLYSPCQANVFVMYLIAKDMGTPQLSSMRINITVIVNRNQNAPQFVGIPYNTILSETVLVNSLVFQVTTRDRDVIAPFNTIRHSIIGDGSAASFFNIDVMSGEIRLSRAILSDLETSYKIRVLAADGGSPSLTATTTVNVAVSRNLFSPQFSPLSYEITVFETQPLGMSILRISATDDDTKSPYNIVRYQATGSQEALNYFSVNSVEGIISAQRSLTLDKSNTNTYLMTVMATDQGSPSRQSNQVATVRINIVRNNNCPQFVNLPASVELFVSQANQFGQSVYNISAVDSDDDGGPFGIVSFDVIGDDNAPVFFTVDPAKGSVYTRTNLFSDSTPVYKLRVRARDGGSPPCERIEVLSITVRRNQFAPVWQPSANYMTTILEAHNILTPITRVQAEDADVSSPNNVVNYKVMENSPNRDLFFIDGTTGDVYLRNSIIGAAFDEYQVHLLAVDGAFRPMNSTTGTLTITVIRNKNPPVFQNEPYSRSVSQNTVAGTSLVTVVASDADTVAPYNSLTYEIIGDDSAPIYFQINSLTGMITFVQPVLSDLSDSYQIRVRVEDGGNPRLSDVTVVTVVVERNLFAPVFSSRDYRQLILESQLVGVPILRVMATDADGMSPNNVVRFSLAGGRKDLDFFLVDSVSGDISLRRPVSDDLNRTAVFQFQALSEDMGSTPQSAIPANVHITVIRNENCPIFQGIPYSMTIPQSVAGLSSIFQVSAIDRDNIAPFNLVKYSLIGDDITPTFFRVDLISGIITLRSHADLTTDLSLKYVARILARDGGIPACSATTTVAITVLRNMFSPIFSNYNFLTRTIVETISVGSVIADVNATDADTTIYKRY